MKTLIFDFDGTLADTLPLALDIAQNVTGVEIPKKDIDKFRNYTIKQILKEAGIPILKVPQLLVKGRQMMSRRMKEVNIFTGLNSELKQLSANHSLYVVSSNSTGIIRSFLDKNGLLEYFEHVYGNVGIFSKAQALKRIIKKQNMNPVSTIYIGDEVRDIEAARKVGIKIASVTWGFNGAKILSSYKPDYLVEKPEEIVKIANQ